MLQFHLYVFQSPHGRGGVNFPNALAGPVVSRSSCFIHGVFPVLRCYRFRIKETPYFATCPVRSRSGDRIRISVPLNNLYGIRCISVLMNIEWSSIRSYFSNVIEIYSRYFIFIYDIQNKVSSTEVNCTSWISQVSHFSCG